MANDLRIKIKVDSNNGELIVTRKEFGKLSKVTNTASKSVKNFSQRLVNMAHIGAGLYVVKQAFDGIVSGVSSLVSTSAQFEKFETTLSTIEGSSKKAKVAMKWIEDFASKTPYQLTDITESFVKLRAYGINPTNGTLKTLGDTASAMGKPLMQAVEAMADAMTGENERLKEFGIKASAQGDKVAYNWVDANNKAKHIVIENNSEMIQSTLSAIFNSKYKDAMKNQMKTYDGMMSNLSDSWTRFKKDIMDSGLFVYIKSVMKVLTTRFQNAFKSGAKASAAFTDTIIDGINSTIEGFGFLYDSITGIKLVLKSIKVLFMGIIKYFVEAINGPIHMLNGLIDAYNALSDKMGYLGYQKIDFKFNKLIDTSGLDKELKNTWDSMGKDVDSLLSKTGKTFTKNFVADVNKAFQQISTDINSVENTPKENVPGSSDGNIRLGSSNKISKSTLKEYNEALKIQKDIERKAKAYVNNQNSQYSKYYNATGQYNKAWNIEKDNIESQFSMLKPEELTKLVAVYKKDFFDKIKDKSKSTWEDMQATMKDSLTSGFEDFFNFTKDGFGDLKKLGMSVADAISNEIIKTQIAKPMASGITSFVGNLFANGGIMSNQGAIPLRAYSNGGIANSPQLAVYGEGRMNEAYVPLPDGKNIPVTMKGNGTNVVIQIENNSGQDVSAKQIGEMTRTNSRGEQEKVISFVMDGVNRNMGGIRDALKGIR